jgi:hypothetical protein
MPKRTLNNEGMASLLVNLRGHATPPPDMTTTLGDAFGAHARLSSVLAAQSLDTFADRRSRATFIAGNIRAYSDLAANLANWERISDPLDLPGRDHLLLAGWHFPELPRVFSFLRSANALLLVSQDAPWLEGLARAGCTANFQTSAGKRAIAAGVAAGRLMGATLDHVHPGTETVIAPLLGRPMPMATGLLAGCLAKGYTVVVLGVSEGRVAVIDRFQGTGLSLADAAARIQRAIDAEIRRAPERWLMWPSLQSRRLPA